MIEQRTPEWHNQRKGMITASSVGAILGFSPHATRDDVLRRMVREWYGAESEFVGNAATEYVTHHEAGAIFEYSMETGNTVDKAPFTVHPEHKWLGASPDGIVNSIGLLEVKCPYSQRKNLKPIFKSIMDMHHYRMQIMVQLACTGRKWCHFYQWAPHGSSAIEVVEYNHELFTGDILPELEKFYAEYINEVDLPAAKKHLLPKRRIIDSVYSAKLLAEYDELSDSIDKFTERKKDILNEMVTMSAEQDAEICGRLLTKVEKQGSVSYSKALKAIAPDANLEPYRGEPTTYWKLT